MKHNIYIYIFLMWAVSFLIRSLPMTLINREIKNPFLKSFLYYVPYVTLSVMTFPAIVNATGSPLAGYSSLIVGILAAWIGAGLFPVSCLCCIVVFLCEYFIH